jgi:recombination protein RecA
VPGQQFSLVFGFNIRPAVESSDGVQISGRRQEMTRMAKKDDKAKALELTRAQIEKQFGKGSIMVLGENKIYDEIEAISTGSLSLDIALGLGGLPKGRVVEIYGPEGSGKTTVCLEVIANCQRGGGVAAFIDAEHAMDPLYARRLGVDIDNLLVSQPDTGEQALEITEMLVRSGAVDIIVIDSVAALVPRAEIEGEMGDSHVGLQARLMSQALRKLTGTISKTNTMVMFTNQIRMKIGVMFGNPETTTGGNALKFYSSVRLDIRRIGGITQGEEVIGNQVRVKVVKNKVAPPFKKAEFDILYGEGISKEGDLIDLGVAANVVQKSGAWYSFGEERLGQGRENARILLKENKDLYEQIKKLVLTHYGIGADAKAAAKAAEATKTEEKKAETPAAPGTANKAATAQAGGGSARVERKA